ncbi:11656_t:CDS:2, partial [Paraglomus brasilianum]
MSQQPFQTTWQGATMELSTTRESEHQSSDTLMRSNQHLLYQNFLTNSQSELQAEQLPQQYQSSPNLSQSPADEPAYTDDSNLAINNQLQQWLSQYPYSRQREVQTSNKSFKPPMQFEHQSDRQNSVQNMLGVFPIEQSELEYVQSQ